MIHSHVYTIGFLLCTFHACNITCILAKQACEILMCWCGVRVCVLVCVRVCVLVCVRVCVLVCVLVGEGRRVCVCSCVPCGGLC